MATRRAQHSDVRIDGPIIEGHLYCVVIRDSRYAAFTHTSLPAPLALCMSKAREYNVKNKSTLAHVSYVGARETTETKKAT